MLLLRLTKHVKDQNWFAVLLDFLIVVVGILIAFQITNWNEGRANSFLERKYIDRLWNDFIDIEERLAANIEYFDESLAANNYIKTLIAEQDTANRVDDQKLKQALRNVFGSRIPAWESATFLEMQSAGDINLLDSLELKTALREYSQSNEIAYSGWLVLVNERSLMNGYFDRYVTYVADDNSTDGTSSYRIDSYDILGIFESDQYQTNLNTMLRIQINSRQLQRIQQQKSDAVISVLQSLRSH